MPRCVLCRAEHPRVGGEDRRVRLADQPRRGTPPRRRGGQRSGRHGPPWARNTPASAGRTPRWPPRRRVRAEHPRVGGEDAAARMAMSPKYGTPPRRRGGHDEAPPGNPAGRNTPASAGRTTASTPAALPATEHPRVGGEDSSLLSGMTGSSGTPPRRRGGRRGVARSSGRLRNTPASAGRTLPDLRLKSGIASSLPFLRR